MISRVLIIGGYGNFGSFISKTLAKENTIQLIIAGRSVEKAQALAKEIHAKHQVEAVSLDITSDLDEALKTIQPDIVVHTSGPFQEQGYHVAKACIKSGAHYIDLADGRAFVENIVELHEEAKANGVLIISGASSVPCLTSALVDNYQKDFSVIDNLDYGITTAQKTARGLATTAAILGYTGKPFQTKMNGVLKNIYGWQGLHARKYPQLGWRLLSNCDVPDLSLFPKRYPEIKTIRFYAGLEISLIHLTLWVLSWLVRFKVIRNFQKSAPLLLKLSYLFDWFGTSSSAFHMKFTGKDNTGKPKILTFELTAGSGDGPYIPSMPAILLVNKLVKKQIIETGAFPCIGFISLEEYLRALSDMDISTQTT